MNPSRPSRQLRHLRGISLIEMSVVIAITVMLMTAGIQLLPDGGPQARRTATDTLAGFVEQGRTAAITSRASVILALAEPWDMPAGDGKCWVALLRIDSESPDLTLGDEELKCTLLGRWKSLPSGVVLLPGAVDGVPNPLDQSKLVIAYGNSPAKQVHGLVIHARGGLAFPTGSAPVVLRIAEGGYRNGKAVPKIPTGRTAAIANCLKIGRVTARSYRNDG